MKEKIIFANCLIEPIWNFEEFSSAVESSLIFSSSPCAFVDDLFEFPQLSNPFNVKGQTSEDLPRPTPANMQSITRLLCNGAPISTSFLLELKEEFEYAELAQHPKLYQYALAYKIVLNRANEQILKRLLKDDYFLLFFGALEYDVPGTRYRSALLSVKFTILLNTPKLNTLLCRIHRLNFLESSWVSKTLDENFMIVLKTVEKHSAEKVFELLEKNSEDLKKLLETKALHSLEFIRQLHGLALKTDSTQFYTLLFDIGAFEFLVNYDSIESILLDLLKAFIEKAGSNVLQTFLKGLHYSPLLLRFCEKALDSSEFFENFTEFSGVLFAQVWPKKTEIIQDFYYDFLLLKGYSQMRNEARWLSELFKMTCLVFNTLAIPQFFLFNHIVPKISQVLTISAAVSLEILEFADLALDFPCLCQPIVESGWLPVLSSTFTNNIVQNKLRRLNEKLQRPRKTSLVDNKHSTHLVEADWPFSELPLDHLFPIKKPKIE